MLLRVRLPNSLDQDPGAVKELKIRDGLVASMGSSTAKPGEDLPLLMPGLLDIQVNGYGGREFSSPTLSMEDVRSITTAQLESGVAQYCPTVTTAALDDMLHGLTTIAASCAQDRLVAAHIAGIHVEGPYISPEDGARGAHPLAHVRPPHWQEFERMQEAAQGRIVLITLSPEYPESPRFIAHAVKSGVTVSLGHLSATSEQIRRAVDAGARLSTHLGNGAHGQLRRHPNYLWSQLADDRLAASLIVDGFHLPAEVVQTFVRAKPSGKCILVSDLSGLAGLPPGRYPSQLCEIDILADGRLVIAGQDQLLAAASSPLSHGIANVMRFAGVDFSEAWSMASMAPARLLGIEPSLSIAIGRPFRSALVRVRNVEKIGSDDFDVLPVPS